MSDSISKSAKASPRAWIGLGVIALPCLLYAMDMTVLNLAVPALTRDLAPTATELLWIVDIYGFMVAGALMTMGALGDRIGRRRLLMIGAAAFGGASALAACASSPALLIAARALLGLAGATLAPSTLSLIRNMFLDEGERRIAISVWIAAFSTGIAIGPLIGGLLLQHFWWGSVFLVNVPVMVLLLILAPVFLPEFRDPDARRLDLVSAAQSLTAILALIWGLKQMAEHGPANANLAACLAGALIGRIFLRRQQRLVDPFIDPGLFRAPAFTAAFAISIVGCFFLVGTFLFTAQYLQLVVGLSPFEAGLWSLPSALAFIFGSLIAPLLASRFPVERVMASGLILMAAGFLILAFVDGHAEFALAVTAMTVFSLGFTPVGALATDLIVRAAPTGRAGAAAAISETGTELGGALGIAVLGSIGAAIYRSDMARGAAAGLSASGFEAAGSTLGGAVATASAYPDDIAAPILAAAQAAFTSGMQTVALIAALGLTATAVMALVALRPRRPPTDCPVGRSIEDAGR